jgi:23S rRNA (guanosine2251-2'-O)-methyltransferase
MKRLLLGSGAALQALRQAAQQVAVVYTEAGKAPRPNELLALAGARNVRCEERERSELDALARGQSHDGVVTITGDYPYVAIDELLERAGSAPLLVALDQVTDPHNFGAIVRSAVGFGADGVITLKDRAAPVTAAVVRAAAGATELTRIARVTNLARTLGELQDSGLQIVGLDMSGQIELKSADYAPAGRVLVVGSEGTGLRRLVREQCDVVAKIPMHGALQSLNVSVAAAIALYESAASRPRRST